MKSKKIIILISLALNSGYLFAQSNMHSTLMGKWVEYKRIQNADGRLEPMNFTDTLEYEFLGDSIVNTRLISGVTLRERFYINADGMFIGDYFHFTKYDMNDSLLNMGDESVMHYFIKVKKFPNRIIPKIEAQSEIIKPERIADDDWIGTWIVYKKSDPEFNGVKMYLKKLIIEGKNIDSSYTVKVTRMNSSEAFIKNGSAKKTNDDVLNITLEDNTVLEIRVVSFNGIEMILEENTALYYLKNFSKTP